MANINKIYPHVNVTMKALLRRTPQVVESDATTMFVPFYAKKGLNNEVKKIYNLSQFISEYGEPDVNYQGRGILNIYNWLNAGGAVYALRLTSPDAVKATDTVTFGAGSMVVEAAYPGAYYNDISLSIKANEYSGDTVDDTQYLDVQILLDGSRVASLYRLKYDTFKKSLESTGYVNVTVTTGATATESQTALEIDFNNFVLSLSKTVYVSTVELENGTDGTLSFEQSLQRFFGSAGGSIVSTIASEASSFTVVAATYEALNWAPGDILVATPSSGTATDVTIVSYTTGASGTLVVSDALAAETYTFTLKTDQEAYVLAEEVIGNKLEYPIDIFLDPGYSQDAKGYIKDFAEDVRDDIFFYFSTVDFSTSESGSFEDAIAFEGGVKYEINQAIYIQKFSVEDVLSGKSIWVAPSYFLASLIPFNDRIYGIQHPTAGLTRGVLSGVEGINLNPTSSQKTANILSKYNYVEKDSRGYTFMAQLTGENENTALQYINNVRVTNRMVRELEELGRTYLFEFNDSTTLTNMRNALVRYIEQWIQNRSLEFGNVTVEKDQFLENAVNVNLVIKFAGIIDVISIDITIE